MRDSTSIFPSGIDSRVFFSDMNLKTRELWNQYYNLISKNKYTQASDFLSNHNLDYYGAWFLNLLENRLVNIGTYLLSLDKPELTVYQNTEPSDADEGIAWIGD